MKPIYLAGIAVLLLAIIAGAVLYEVVDDEEDDDVTTEQSAASGSLPPVADGSARKLSDPYAPAIDPANFTTNIDNPWFPLLAGTVRVYEETNEDGEKERIVVTATNDTKVVMGVTTRVVRDTVTINGELLEDTFDYFAQDKDGNVWYFGEYTTEYENGKPSNHHGAWEAGVNGAQPGIYMLGSPRIGDEYRQEYAKGEAEDTARVLSLSEKVTVKTGNYDNVLKTADYTPLDSEPTAQEEKFYAKGLGLVLSTNKAGERAELIEAK